MFFLQSFLPKDAGWTLFLFDLIREPHWKFCGSTTRDSAHAQNGECGYAGSSQSPKRLKKVKTPRKLWKERDVTLAPRNVECDDIRIFPARWPTKVLPQFPLWSVLKDSTFCLNYSFKPGWFSAAERQMLFIPLAAHIVDPVSAILRSVGWSANMVWYCMVWCGVVWYGVVWYGMVGRWANMATITRG